MDNLPVYPSYSTRSNRSNVLHVPCWHAENSQGRAAQPASRDEVERQTGPPRCAHGGETEPQGGVVRNVQGNIC